MASRSSMRVYVLPVAHAHDSHADKDVDLCRTFCVSPSDPPSMFANKST
jgi:hypothetical protein